MCVGHARGGDNGSVSVTDVSEYDFWKPVAGLVCERLREMGVEHMLVTRYEGRSYGAAMSWLAAKLEAAGATLAVELHFNWSLVRVASGHEWLYYQHSQEGRFAARFMDLAMREHFPKLQGRGIKQRGRNERGSQFLTKPHCPAVIAEPFFGSCQADWDAVAEHPGLLASALAAGMAAADEVQNKLPR